MPLQNRVHAILDDFNIGSSAKGFLKMGAGRIGLLNLRLSASVDIRGQMTWFGQS
jgi:hypothetical protein